MDIKNQIKGTDFKFRDYKLYRVKDDFIFSSMFSVTVLEKGFKIHINVDVKPCDIDDLFWDIFNMSENKDEPDSLRVIGAFTIISLDIIDIEVYDAEIENDYSLELLEKIDIEINKFILTAKENPDTFYDLAENDNQPDKQLVKMLYLIKNEEYSDALQLVNEQIGKGERGRFSDDEKTINEYIRDYCMKKLGMRVPKKSFFKKLFGQ